MFGRNQRNPHLRRQPSNPPPLIQAYHMARMYKVSERSWWMAHVALLACFHSLNNFNFWVFLCSCFVISSLFNQLFSESSQSSVHFSSSSQSTILFSYFLYQLLCVLMFLSQLFGSLTLINQSLCSMILLSKLFCSVTLGTHFSVL